MIKWLCIHSHITKETAPNYRAIPLSFSSLLASVSFPFSARSFHSFSPLPCGSNCVQQLTLSLSLLHAIAYVHSMPTIVCLIQADFIDSLSSVDATGLPKSGFVFVSLYCYRVTLMGGWFDTFECQAYFFHSDSIVRRQWPLFATNLQHLVFLFQCHF